jgi:hypothetical protein
MTVKISDWVDAQKPILNSVFDTAWDGSEESYSKMCHVKDSSDAYEVDLQMQSPDEISESVEGGAYTRVEIENIRKKTYTHSLFKGEIRITQEMIEDCKYEQIYNAVRMLAVAAKRTVERRAASALYNGFTTELSPDGAAVFSTHTLDNPLAGRPTTYANKTTGQLNATNLKSRRVAGRKVLDEHGSMAPKNLTNLIVPSNGMFKGEQLLVTSSNGEPGTANNDRNVVGKGMKLIVNPWLDEAANYADDQWYLQDPEEHAFKFWWRVRPQQNRVMEEASGDVLYRVRMRFSVGFSDWRGMDGSTGQT